MVVRIRLTRGYKAGEPLRASRRLLLAAAALLQPAAVMAGVLAFWRFGADLHWTREFAISSGLLSHWQVWVGVFVTLQISVIVLDRWGRRKRRTSRIETAKAVDATLAKSQF